MRTIFTGATFHTMESPEDVHASMTVEDGVIVAFDELPIAQRASQPLTRRNAISASISTGNANDSSNGVSNSNDGTSGSMERSSMGLSDGANSGSGTGRDSDASGNGTAGNGTASSSAECDSTANTAVVNLGGGHVFPALIDSHLHLADAIGTEAIGIPLCRVEDNRIEPHNLAGVREAIEALAASKPHAEILMASNYIAQAMDERRLPTRTELDEWTGGRRIWVLNMDGHSSACSTILLNELGLAETAPDGILRGETHDANLGRIADTVAKSLSLPSIARGLAHFINRCAAWGISCLCALDGADDIERDSTTEVLCRLFQRLPLDVRLYPQYQDVEKLVRVLPLMRRPRVGGCAQWELDGSVGSSTAAFRTPFKDGTQGSLYFTREELQPYIEVFAGEGMQVTAHAIGECAIDQLLDIYEDIPYEPDESGNFPHRIDHCEFPSAQAVCRAAALKPYITVQPGYAWFDKHYLHGYETTLPPHLVAQQVPLRTLMEAGVPLLGSSDAPVQSPDPYLQMRGMREFYLEEESLTAFQALQTYTVNAGQALGERRGKLAVGYQADFMLHKRNLLELAPAELSGLTANRLYVRGRAYRPLPESTAALAQILANRPRKI